MRFAVSPQELGTLAGTMRKAADGLLEMHHHQGPIHGKARDGGDPAFQAAVEEFASRWMWGIEVLGRDVDLLADLVGRAAQAYSDVEAETTQTWLPGGG